MKYMSLVVSGYYHHVWILWFTCYGFKANEYVLFSDEAIGETNLNIFLSVINMCAWYGR